MTRIGRLGKAYSAPAAATPHDQESAAVSAHSTPARGMFTMRPSPRSMDVNANRNVLPRPSTGARIAGITIAIQAHASMRSQRIALGLPTPERARDP
jgi:hypothetical protein